MGQAEHTESTTSTTRDAQLRRLTIYLDGHRFHAAISSTVDDSEPIIIESVVADGATALEDAVYGLPGLVDDYARVDAILRTSSFTLLPSDADADIASDVASIMGFDDDVTPHLTRLRRSRASMVWTAPAAVENFLARTFRNPVLHHADALLASYFSSCTIGGNAAKTFVHFGIDSVDIASYDAGGRLQLLCAKETPTETDALYYIMSVLKESGFDMCADRLMICGDKRRQRSASSILRRYVGNVLPVIALTGAFAAMRDDVPFPVKILPLCE